MAIQSVSSFVQLSQAASEVEVQKLPMEVLQQIFSGLDFHSAHKASLTCKHWRNAAMDPSVPLGKVFAVMKMAKGEPVPNPVGGANPHTDFLVENDHYALFKSFYPNFVLNVLNKKQLTNIQTLVDVMRFQDCHFISQNRFLSIDCDGEIKWWEISEQGVQCLGELSLPSFPEIQEFPGVFMESKLKLEYTVVADGLLYVVGKQPSGVYPPYFLEVIDIKSRARVDHFGFDKQGVADLRINQPGKKLFDVCRHFGQGEFTEFGTCHLTEDHQIVFRVKKRMDPSDYVSEVESFSNQRWNVIRDTYYRNVSFAGIQQHFYHVFNRQGEPLFNFREDFLPQTDELRPTWLQDDFLASWCDSELLKIWHLPTKTLAASIDLHKLGSNYLIKHVDIGDREIRIMTTDKIFKFPLPPGDLTIDGTPQPIENIINKGCGFTEWLTSIINWILAQLKKLFCCSTNP
jgi:hypothetical protein